MTSTRLEIVAYLGHLNKRHCRLPRNRRQSHQRLILALFPAETGDVVLPAQFHNWILLGAEAGFREVLSNITLSYKLIQNQVVLGLVPNPPCHEGRIDAEVRGEGHDRLDRPHIPRESAVPREAGNQ